MFELNLENNKNYTIKSCKKLDEDNIYIVELVHNKTKAKVILFICNDENRVFNIAFKTPVNNSKGMPHILEHSVLCGSRKYDVKDPFMELAKSSMNTFLNAITFDDKTCYPVASANLKDFHNLVDVYLDAVFYPNVIKDERFFRQEGWHYEITKKEDPLIVNGVVYNEMRGVFSNPDDLLEYNIAKSLFPNTNYQYVSGGRPIDIMDLSYEEFVDFHQKYYSASNSIIYFYGKLDYNEELKYLNDEYLSKQEYIDINPEFTEVKNYVKDIEDEAEYNLEANDNADKSYISYSFAIEGEKSCLKHITMQVIDYILFSSEGAIIREKCQNAGLGEEIYTMHNQSQKVDSYSIIAKNINKNKKEDFKKIIIDSFKEIVENGLDENKIKAALNVSYFNYVEDEFGSTPKGLALILSSLDSYLYTDFYDTYISYKKPFEILFNENFKSKDNIITNTIKEVFIDNAHRCINILNPSSTFQAQKEAIIKEKLDKRKNEMNDTDIINEINKCSELKEFQKTEDSSEKLNLIPKLDISDIDRDKKFISYNKTVIDGADVIASNDNDKDIIYILFDYDVSEYTYEELCMLSIISKLILSINLENKDYHEFNEYIDINTGGFVPKITITDEKILFGYEIKVTQDNIDKAFYILKDAINYVTFKDKKRIAILLNEIKSKSLTGLLSNGHTAAFVRASSRFLSKFNATDIVCPGNIGFQLFINELVKAYNENADEINKLLIDIYEKTKQNKIYFSYCANEKYDKKVIENFENFIKEINDKQKNVNIDLINENVKNGIINTSKYIHYDKFGKKVKKEAIITPNDINFCALASSFPKEQYNGRLNILRVLFNYEYLWTNLRVLGGAYGCMFFANKNGSYGFASYRDPNLSNTNKTFLNVKNYLKNFDKSDEELKKYIIGTMSGIDNPFTTLGRFLRNVNSYYNHLDDEMVNEERHCILDSKSSDIKDLYKIFDDIEEKCSMCALIAENKIDEAKAEYDNVWRIVE